MKASECISLSVYRAIRNTGCQESPGMPVSGGWREECPRPDPPPQAGEGMDRAQALPGLDGIRLAPRPGLSGRGRSVVIRRVGRSGDVVALEPGQNVVDLRDHARGLAGDAVRAFGHAYHHRIDASELERLVVLLGLRNRRAVVVLASDQKR